MERKFIKSLLIIQTIFLFLNVFTFLSLYNTTNSILQFHTSEESCYLNELKYQITETEPVTLYDVVKLKPINYILFALSFGALLAAFEYTYILLTKHLSNNNGK